MSGDERNLDAVISSTDDRYVKKEMFISIVSKIIHAIGCYTDALKAYHAIRLEMEPKNIPHSSVIRYYHKGNQELVPKDMYIAAKKALRTLTGEGPAEKMINCVEAEEKKETKPENKRSKSKAEEKNRKKKKSTGRQKSKDFVLEPNIKDYKVPDGEVPYFALKAMIKAFKRNNGFCSIPSLDERLYEEGSCKKGALKREYSRKKNCTGQIYDGIINLLRESNDMERLEQEQLEKLREVETYDPEKSYRIGQIIRVQRWEFGVVTGKEKFDIMIVYMQDGQERMFRERLEHDKSREKKPIDPFMME